MRGVGITNPMFFVGVVEDNDDKSFQGRVRVRAFGVHGSNAEIKPWELPWAICVSGAYTADDPVPPLNSFVFGVFLDGEEAQHPLVLGMIPTQYLEDHEPGKDGWGVIPVKNGDLLAKGFRPEDVGEHQRSKVGRGERIQETYHEAVSSNVIPPQKIANSDKTWSQPASAYAAQYPYNRVIETARHTIELDDTPGNERIMIHHVSGAFIQIDSKGTTTEKAMGDRYEINIGTKHESSGHSVVTINGNAHVYVKGNKTEEIMGDYKLLVHGNHEVNVGQNLFQIAGTSLQTRAANVKIEANSDTLTLFGKSEIQFEAEKQLNFVSANIKNTALMNFDVYSNKSIKFTTVMDIHMQASNIIMSAHGLIPPNPLNGASLSTPGFHLTATTINMAGFAGLPTYGSFNGFWNADIINGGVVTGTNVNATTLQATAMSAAVATFGISNHVRLRAASYTGPIGSTPAVVPPPVIAIPTIPLKIPPAQSLLIPPPVPGSSFSGWAYPSPNGNIVDFFTGVLTSPFAALGIPNPLGTGGYGIKRVQAPEPVSPSYSLLANDYNLFGSNAGYSAPLGDTARDKRFFDSLSKITGENTILDIINEANDTNFQFDENGEIVIPPVDIPEPEVVETVFDESNYVIDPVTGEITPVGG